MAVWDHVVFEEFAVGDRRSIGNADRLAVLAAGDVRLFDALIDALSSDDPVVRMRAADAAEKASRRTPSLLASYKATLLERLAQVEQQEVLWHLLQMLPRFSLTPNERAQGFEVAVRSINHKSRVVAAEALSAMFALAGSEPLMRKRADATVEQALTSPSAAVRARARKLTRSIRADKA